MAAQADIYGIVTARRQDRQTYARFIERRVFEKIATPAIQKAINRMVDERLRKEVDVIVAERMAAAGREMEAAKLPAGPTIATILAAVSEATGFTDLELAGPRRAQPVSCARQIAYHMLRTLRPDLSLPGIGRALGFRDHTTIMHGLGAFERKREAEPIKTWLAHPAIAALMKPAATP